MSTRIDRGGYVFYCSKCKFEHDGECEPAAPSKETLEAIYRDTKAFANALYKAHVATRAPGVVPPPKLGIIQTSMGPNTATYVRGYSPTLGSRWVAETRHNPTDPWKQAGTAGTADEYEVISLGSTKVDVRIASGNFAGSTFDLGYDYWYEDGTLRYGSWLRMVPAP